MTEKKQRYAVDLDLTGRVALVTGGSRGIGRAVSLALAAHGAKIAVNYCSHQSQAAEVVEEICAAGGEALAVQADLRDGDAAARLISSAAEALGPIDILVNNAGEMTDGPVETMTDEVWDRALSLNLTAAFRTARACIPMMRSRKWGRISKRLQPGGLHGVEEPRALCSGEGGAARTDLLPGEGGGGGGDYGEYGGAGPNYDRSAA